jgi:type IV fimbrial biogenesis protein FimT
VLIVTVPGRCRGFSLVEILIAMTILALLLLLALPNMSEYLRNSTVRTAAEIISSGVQLARSEAIRRNTPVEFALVSADPTQANVSVAADAAGPHWIVRTFQPTAVYTAPDFIQGGGAYSTRNAVIAADSANFSFGSLGRTDLGGNNTIRVTYPSGGNCVADGGSVRCLNVVVQIGGQVRMCDPAVTAAGDTRAC